MSMRVLIADDNALARAKLRQLVADVPWAECVGEAGDGPAVLEAIERLGPDLVFLDIRMPGLSGLEVLRRARHRPHVIFTTAYAEHAVEAFELQALDYLLKPFGRDRFLQAIERARDTARPQSEPTPSTTPVAAPLRRLFVHARGKILPVTVDTIERFEADADYVAVWVERRRFLMRITLETVASRLDPEQFCRVHRSHLVNLDHVAAMVPFDGSRLQIEMQSGAKLIASRSRSRQLRRRLGVPE
ncbi:MAG: LytTR family DNA-binding domain-containing protein [Acidobacteriota bacterium]